MARIRNYVTDNNITDQDIVVGSDGDNSGVTKNFNVATLKQYVSNGLVEEAPIDGIAYARKNGDWVISSISSDEVIDVETYADLPYPGSSDVLYITLDTGKLWLWSDGYSEVNQASISPFSTITEGINVGIARTGRNPLYYGNIGVNAIDMSSSTIPSSTNGATGENSFASGKSNIASGNYSNSQNIYNKANGYASSASGMYSTASGQAETAIGMYGTEYVPTNTITDKVFNVGAGTSTLNKKDVFSLFRNLAAKFTPTALSSITNQVAGFFIFDSSDSNRPAVHNGTDWKKLSYQDDIPNLDEVTNEGNTTDNSIIINDASSKPSYTDDWVSSLTYSGNGSNAKGILKLREFSGGDGFVSSLSTDILTDNRSLSLPDKNGVIAVLTDVPSVDSVPTNGSTNAVSSDGVFDALALKADLVAGKVPSSQLPSYVDDVIEGYYFVGSFYYDAGFTTPIVGETGKIYVDLLANKSYRWSGSVYIQISNAISSIDELTDVTVSSPLNGQLLQYNLTTNQWENQSITIGTGDMQKSTYDTDNDGIVDFAETVPVTVRNPSVTDILRKGTIVYLSGSTGYRPNAYKAQANAESTSSGTFGVVLSDIATNSDGTIATLGTIHTLDTRTSANGAPYPFTNDVLADGNALWLDPNNAGYVTNVKPQAPNHIVFIGVVARTHPSLGRIVYRITNGYELDELHNVFINGTLADKHTLYYDAATSLWKTNTITGTLGYTPENLANKSTSVVTDQASNTKYPTVKAVYDWAVGAFTTTSAVATQITTALSGYATQSWVTSQGYITNVISALGFTPVTNARTISTTGPLTGGGDLTADRTLSISQSNTTTNGYLSSTDWNTFNNKQAALVSSTNIKTINGSSILGSGDLAITGGVQLTRQEFSYIGAQTFTLSATPSYIYAVFVNGQELNSSQYSFVTTTLTIADTLESGDKINIVYSETAGGVLDYYTKAQIDAFNYESKHANFIEVNNVSDLPASSGGVITLVAGYTYLILKHIDLLGARIVCGADTVIVGWSSENCSISSTGLSAASALITSNYSLPIRNISFTHDLVFDLQGDGTTTALDWFGVNLLNCASGGTIKNYSNFVAGDSALLNSGGFSYDGTIGTVAFSNCLFDVAPTKTAINILPTCTISRRVRIIYSSFVVSSGETGVNFSTSATVSDERYILDTVNFSGGGTYTTGITSTSNKALFSNCVGITNTSTRGFMHMLDNVTATAITGTASYFKAAGTTTASSANSKFTMPSDNRLTYTGAFTQSFFVTVNCNVRTSVSTQTVNIVIAKNGTNISESEMTILCAAGSTPSFGGTQCVVELTANDYIELYVRNTSSVNNVIVSDFNMNILKIPV